MEKIKEVFDVIVVGAGWSGLLSAKYCIGENLQTLVIEGREKIGGVWAYTDDCQYGGVMKTTETTSSKCITEISDFPMPDNYPDFPSHSQIYSYLESYASHFSVIDNIIFSQKVTSIIKENDYWQVTTSGGQNYWAKNVIVSSGVHQHPNDVSDNLRFRNYDGKLIHSAGIKEVSTNFSDKKVLVWGGGESASDISFELSKVASKVYFCIPNGQWFVPKFVDRWYPFPSSQRKIVDHHSSRLRLLLSPTHRYSPFVSQFLRISLGFNGHGQKEWRTTAPYNRSFFNKSANVLSAVNSGSVKAKRDVSYCNGRVVHFTDNTSATFDYIITCSGYKASFPFLKASKVTSNVNQQELFKYIFYNQDPTLAFVGFVRPIFGSIPGISELQSRYVSKVISAKCKLPTFNRRSEIISKDMKFWNHHFRYTSLRLTGLVDHFMYTNQLAKLIGCYPNFKKLLISNPGRWWQAITAPWNGCQFWLNDEQQHSRIFKTLKQYDDNRLTQIYIYLVLSPILPFISLFSYLRIMIKESTIFRK
ncbi:MAG: NAD(P)-binding domain-containing protein [Ectothiorhodospiraceae bacterium]|nr:NAD(P)-binding domain-containing protein [Ectothiorhodospiraceae bacterium]